MATLLEKAKGVCRVTSTTFDDEITDLIAAGFADLGITDIDASLLNSALDADKFKPLIIRALMTYVSMNFKLSNAQIDVNAYDRLKEAYNEQKTQMIMSSEYNGSDFEGWEV